MIYAKLISALDKCFPAGRIEDCRTVTSSYAYRNSVISLQIALTADSQDPVRRFATFEVSGIPGDCVNFRLVEFVQSLMPVYPGRHDSGYIDTRPGLYPDILAKLQNGGEAPVSGGILRTVWVDIDMKKIPAGYFPEGADEAKVVFRVTSGEDSFDLPYTLRLIPADLPDHGMTVTEWFHCDCLAEWYHVPVFSEEHWRIIENFMRTYVECGNNAVLTPVFTPPLDTRIGGERPTVQLVGVKKGGNGRYYFDFTLLDRWIETADRCGVKRFEISHLFTQWGAKHAPKVVATLPDGRTEKIFGWETDSTGHEYVKFLRAFLKAFLAHMKARGDDKRCLFHISDEPHEDQIEQYLKAKESVADLLEGYTVMDALSNIAFFESGAVSTPVPSSNHIEPFIAAFEERGLTGRLWTYYCCGQCVGVSNRLIAMYGARTRYIGLQFWKYRIAGFLQWGYNFYFNQGSRDLINPYIESTGYCWVPSGDAFSVYPAPDGTALESMRINHFREALEDLSALRLCESLIGRERLLAELEAVTGEIVFSKCEYDSGAMEGIRALVDRLTSEALRGR